MSIDKDIMRHASEFRRALASHDYERTGTGLYFPRLGVEVGGEFTLPGGRAECNMLLAEGLDYLLEVGLRDAAKRPNWYLALYGGNYMPDETLTGAIFPALAGEITSPTTGYSETTRPAWTAAAASGGQMDNYGNEAAFSIVTPAGTELLIYGAAILSDSTKGGTTGKILACRRFASVEKRSNGSTFELGYRIRLRQP